jgi:hypothetical protein
VERDEEAARLLDRIADLVRVAPAPLERVVDAGRRRRRRLLLATAGAVLLTLVVLLAVAGAPTR